MPAGAGEIEALLQRKNGRRIRPDLDFGRKPVAAYRVDDEIGAIGNSVGRQPAASETTIRGRLAQSANLGDQSVAFHVRIERNRPPDFHRNFTPHFYRL